MKKQTLAIALCLPLTLLTLQLATSSIEARGGGGGGRGFSGGGRSFAGGDRGFGDRGYGDRGFGDRGLGDRGLGDRFGDMGDRGGDRFDDGPLSHTSESDLRSEANHDWNTDHPLSTDGFDGMAGAAAGSTRRLSGADIANRAGDVRNNFNNYGAFGRNFWNRYPNAWRYGGWGDGYLWGGVGWGDLAGYWDVPVVDTPTDYDYGDNITYQGDNVYYGSQPVATTDQYYQQAQTLAMSTPSAVIKNGIPNTGLPASWKPLGVYSLTPPGQTDTSTLFQIAVNKEGAIRGNYYNTLTSEVKPIKGKVDKKSGRAAWMIEGNSTVIYDCGLSNLLHDQAPILVHNGKNKTEQLLLIKEKQENKQATSPQTKKPKTI